MNDVSRVAWTLFGHAFNSVHAKTRLTVDQADEMTIGERIDAGDREAIYDAIVEAREQLNDLREKIGSLLVESADTLDRLNALRSAKQRYGESISPLVRWKQKESPHTDAKGPKRARSGKSR